MPSGGGRRSRLAPWNAPTAVVESGSASMAQVLPLNRLASVLHRLLRGKRQRRKRKFQRVEHLGVAERELVLCVRQCRDRLLRQLARLLRAHRRRLPARLVLRELLAERGDLTVELPHLLGLRVGACLQQLLLERCAPAAQLGHLVRGRSTVRGGGATSIHTFAGGGFFLSPWNRAGQLAQIDRAAVRRDPYAQAAVSGRTGRL